MTVLGVVLAGGASTRMGATDKVLAELGGETLLARAVARLAPQVDAVVVNGPEALCARCDVPVVPDTIEGRAGPLAGLLAAMKASDADAFVTVAVDTPFFPPDLAARLSGETVGIARADGRLQPVFGRWPRAAEEPLASFLAKGDRKIMTLAGQLGYRAVDFAEPDAFFNINVPANLERARAMLEET